MWAVWITEIFLFAAVVYFVLIVRVYVDVRIKRKLKGPFPLPFFGNTIAVIWGEMWGQDRIEGIEELFARYGETWYMDVAGFKQITTMNPDNIRHVTTKEENFSNYAREPVQKGWEFKAVYQLFGSGIFVTDGEIWSTQRTMSHPLFTKNSLDQMHSVFVQKALSASAILQRYCDSGEEIDIQELVQKYTLDSFGVVGFGTEINSLDHPVAFSKAFDKAQYLLNEFFFNPVAKYTNAVKEYDDCIQTLDEFIYGLIDRSSQENSFDLLSRFKTLVDPSTTGYKKFLRDIILNFAIAGRDTTACLLTWTIHCLNQHPEFMQRVKKEIETVLGDKEIPSSTDLQKLSFLSNVLSETLRLYPSVPGVGRFAIKDDILPDGTVVKAGDFVTYLNYSLGRNHHYWKDPLVYNPDRWDKKSDMKHPFQYLPFHAGPMQCLGRHMALNEAKGFLCLILRKYSFIENPKKPILPYFGILLPAKNGAWMTVQKDN